MILPGEGATHDAGGEKTANGGKMSIWHHRAQGRRGCPLWSTVSKSPKMSFETEK